MTFAELKVVNLAVAGNVVLTERVDSFHFEGKQLAVPVMGAFEVAGDKIAAWRDYYDTGSH